MREPPILKRWLDFLQKHAGQVRGITRDTWNMFLNFSDVVGNDLSVYDEDEAWPSLFDDFVEYENDQANQNYEVDKPESKEGSNSPSQNPWWLDCVEVLYDGISQKFYTN